MPLTIKPPRPPSQEPSLDPTTQQSAPQLPEPQRIQPRPPSPVAPAYSPITPKVLPVLPATYSQHEPAEVPPVPPPPAAAQHIQQSHASIASSSSGTPNSQHRGTPPAPVTTNPLPPPSQPQQQSSQPVSSIQPTQYIPQPANLPFSSDDATDAIALRAAISTLQFQKQKAQDDLRKLERIKQQAQAEPERFRTELAAGRLKEQKPSIGNLQNILDQVEDGDDDDEVVLDMGPRNGSDTEMGNISNKPDEVPDSQMSESGLPPTSDNQHAQNEQKPFPPIPGPQSIVRMPPVNWDKYHVVGQPLDSLHEQQRRWPGQQPFVADRGREHVVAAPYSPFQDRLDQEPQGGAQQSGGNEGRKDSRALSDAVAPSPPSGPGEHPMATRRLSERRP